MKKQTLVIGRRPDSENVVLVEDGHLSEADAEKALRMYLYNDNEDGREQRVRAQTEWGTDVYMDVLVHGSGLHVVGSWY